VTLAELRTPRIEFQRGDEALPLGALYALPGGHVSFGAHLAQWALEVWRGTAGLSSTCRVDLWSAVDEATSGQSRFHVLVHADVAAGRFMRFECSLVWDASSDWLPGEHQRIVAWLQEAGRVARAEVNKLAAGDAVIALAG